MDTQTTSTFQTPSLTPLKEVFVDVYAWLKAIETHRRFVMEGVFRHADALSRLYIPAYYLAIGEQDFSAETLSIFKAFVGKDPFIFKSVPQIAASGCRVWLSLAVDFPAPFLYLKTPFKKVAILHDSLAGEGVFGEDKVNQFKFGALNNDAFAYVSVYSLHRFGRVTRNLGVKPKSLFIQYGCFHTLTELPSQAGVRTMTDALTVHSLYPRKNIEDSARIACSLGLDLLHVGHNYYLTDDQKLDLHRQTKVWFHGPAEESALLRIYRNAGTFIYMSKDEGFSIPPLEAILYSVPTVILSDILVHREIYGRYSVNFVKVPFTEPITHLFTVTDSDRRDVFERFKFENVAKELRETLAEI